MPIDCITCECGETFVNGDQGSNCEACNDPMCGHCEFSVHVRYNKLIEKLGTIEDCDNEEFGQGNVNDTIIDICLTCAVELFENNKGTLNLGNLDSETKEHQRSIKKYNKWQRRLRETASHLKYYIQILMKREHIIE